VTHSKNAPRPLSVARRIDGSIHLEDAVLQRRLAANCSPLMTPLFPFAAEAAALYVPLIDLRVAGLHRVAEVLAGEALLLGIS
jgi:hypothetical protein